MEEIGRGGLLLEALNYVWQVWSCKSLTCSTETTTPDDSKLHSSAVRSAAEYGSTIGSPLTDAFAVGNPSFQPSEQPPLQSASRVIGHDVVGGKMLKQRTGLGHEAQQRTYSLRDVERHNHRDDCWIVIKGKVYDVSAFGKQHPGGSVIYTYAGRDATDVFSAFHAASTWKLVRQFYIGELVDDSPTPELLNDFREMRAALLREKMFESSKTYYVFKTLSVWLIGAMSLTVLLSYASSSLVGFWVSAFLMALFWQQSGWLAHDFLHHQVFEARWMNSAMGYLLGNVMQGFSNGWWKSKHNTHHAAPNECDTDFRAVDPDIDTLPLLAWSRDMLSQIHKDGWHRFLVRIQCYMFFPILLFARLSWCYQSVIWGQNSQLPAQVRLVEGALLLLHYVWLSGAAFLSLPPVGAVSWILLSELLCGLLLGIVFVQSHNGMEVYNDTKDFVSAQVVSTRDIQSNLFNDWFTGGLNRQIEHHLFPTLPRHNLGKIAGRVKALCEKHDLAYEDVGMLTGTRRVLDRLADVASVA